MSGNPHHALRKRGARLASALEDFLAREIPDPEERAQVLVGVLAYLERRTLTVRDAGGLPTAEPDSPPSPN
jgi:hypothetical protein